MNSNQIKLKQRNNIKTIALIDTMKLLLVIALLAIGADAFCRKFPVWPQDFKWSYAGPINGMHCTRILETADPHTWKDNFLCHKTGPKYLPVGMRWHSAGIVAS